MTLLTFDAARSRGTGGKIGQLNPLGRYGVAEGAYVLSLKAQILTMLSDRNRTGCSFLGFR